MKVAWATYKGDLCAQEALVLAQRGALLPPSEPEPVLPIPKSHTSSVINEAVEKRWNHRWTHKTTTARQSRMFWPQIDKQKSNQLLLCNRQEFGEVIRLFTGHNYLNRHQFLLQETDSEECRLCHEDDETSEHLLCHCPALGDSRLRVLGQANLSASALVQRPLDGQRRFISLIRRALLDEGAEKI